MYYAILLLIILVLASMYANLHFKYRAVNKAFDKVTRWWTTAENAYEQLNKGFTEVTDAYQTDMLQYEDTIEKLHAHVADQKTDNDALRRANAEYHEENVNLKKQIDIAQVIISNHDLNCLPHIVLKDMEETIGKTEAILADIEADMEDFLTNTPDCEQ